MNTGERRRGGLLAAISNHNVALALLYRLIDASAQGLFGYSALTAYVYLLTKSNKYVGVMQGIQGTTLVLAALPAGWLADRTRRDTVLKGHAAFGLAAIATSVLALLAPSVPVPLWSGASPVPSSFLLLCAGNALFGVCYAGNPVVEALFADSSPTGVRSLLYVCLYSVTVLATSLGPALAALLFALRGNEWHLEELRPIILAGLVVSVVSMMMLAFFDDDKALGDDSNPLLRPNYHDQQQQGQRRCGKKHRTGDSVGADGHRGSLAKQQQQQQDGCCGGGGGVGGAADGTAVNGTAVGGAAGITLNPTLLQDGGVGSTALGTAVGGLAGQSPLPSPPESPRSNASSSAAGGSVRAGGSTSGSGGRGGSSQWGVLGFMDERWIPGIMTCSDLLFGLGSGMLIKFIPVWFLQDVGLDPVRTNVVLAVTPLVLSAASLACQRLSRRVGRVTSCLVCRIAGVVLITWMGYQPSMWSNLKLIIPVYIARTAVMNCTYPTQRSLLMDFVPKANRAKWTSLEAVMQFGWSGSAVVGGVLVDRYGFDTAFIITGAVQALATSIFALLLLVVPPLEPVLLEFDDEEEGAAGVGPHGQQQEQEEGAAGAPHGQQQEEEEGRNADGEDDGDAGCSPTRRRQQEARRESGGQWSTAPAGGLPANGPGRHGRTAAAAAGTEQGHAGGTEINNVNYVSGDLRQPLLQGEVAPA